MEKRKVSLKWGLMTAILVGWIAAVMIVVSIAGFLINYNFRRNLEQAVESNAQNILRQVQVRMEDYMESSKAVSYDGTVRSAYRRFTIDGDEIGLYRTVTEYLLGSFSRDAKFRAVFLSLWNPDITSNLYVINEKTESYAILQQYLGKTRSAIMEAMAQEETGIRFLVYDGQLFMCRNMLDSDFKPYATVIMLCDTNVLFQAFQPVTAVGETVIRIDGQDLLLSQDNLLVQVLNPDLPEQAAMYTADIDNHEFSFYVTPGSFDIWKDMPGLKLAVLMALLLVLPILFVMIRVFYKNISEPMETLVDAASRVQAGERGYQIEKTAVNEEFQSLYRQFNAMSGELKEQFERSRLEQQSLQHSRIKALQSQINPHFLNNTLEIINWEARMAGNDSVSEMIDALSTMLEAALDRDGTGTTTLGHEMEYVNAYLLIIRKRLGDRFRVKLDVPQEYARYIVPKLVLQPIVENAVEHDITGRKGGLLEVNARVEEEHLILEVLHEGTLKAEDRESIRQILSRTPAEPEMQRGRSVGLRNVATRLQLMYGDRSRLTIDEADGIVCARVSLPILVQI